MHRLPRTRKRIWRHCAGAHRIPQLFPRRPQGAHWPSCACSRTPATGSGGTACSKAESVSRKPPRPHSSRRARWSYCGQRLRRPRTGCTTKRRAAAKADGWCRCRSMAACRRWDSGSSSRSMCRMCLASRAANRCKSWCARWPPCTTARRPSPVASREVVPSRTRRHILTVGRSRHHRRRWRRLAVACTRAGCRRAK